MAQQAKDLQHVMDVLEGCLPAVPSRAGFGDQRRRGGSGQGAKRGRSQAGTPAASQDPSQGAAGAQGGRPKAGRSAHDKWKPKKQMPARGSGNSTGDGHAAASQQHQQQPRQQPQETAGSPQNEPGPLSTQRVWHCAACDVWVPRREGDWDTHVRGIRHQRQLLSLRVHGERGKLVLSTFESPPGPSEPSYRLVGKGAAQFGLSTPPSPAAPSEPLLARQLEAARGLRTQALAQLLNLFGVGPTYNAAAQELSEPRLAAALATTVDPSAGGRDAPGNAATVSVERELVLLLTSPAAVAAASHRVHREGFAAGRARVHVDLEGQPFGALAASLGALQLLLGAIGAAPSVAHITLSLKHSGLGTMPAYQLSQLERAWGAHVVRGLGGLLELNPAIRWMRLEVPPVLAGPSRQQLPALRAAAQAAPVASRQLLLLALHPRVGRCSVLQLLPLPLVREVMDLAAPLQPCSIEVQAEPGE